MQYPEASQWQDSTRFRIKKERTCRHECVIQLWVLRFCNKIEDKIISIDVDVLIVYFCCCSYTKEFMEIILWERSKQITCCIFSFMTRNDTSLCFPISINAYTNKRQKKTTRETTERLAKQHAIDYVVLMKKRSKNSTTILYKCKYVLIV